MQHRVLESTIAHTGMLNYNVFYLVVTEGLNKYKGSIPGIQLESPMRYGRY